MIYRQVAGVGRTIDNMREYLLVTYAQAYDALDRHLILGTQPPTRYSPREIAETRLRFDNLIKIARYVKDTKAEKAITALKNVTIKYMQGKTTVANYLATIKRIAKSYGIKTAELKRIEEKIDMIEARMRQAPPAPRTKNVFSGLNTFFENLTKPMRRRGRRR